MNAPRSLVDEMLSQLQGAPVQQMAQQLGVNSSQAQTAIEAALPLLIGALGKNAAQPQGAADLFGALQRDHSQAMPQGLGGLGDLLSAVMGGGAASSNTGMGNGGAILGHIFGNNRQRAEAGLGQATGLGNNAGALLQMLAPLVMAFLAQRVQSGGMDAGSLGQTLGQERARVQNQGGLGGGLLGSLLDQDGDGQVGLSDLMKLGSTFLGGRR